MLKNIFKTIALFLFLLITPLIGIYFIAHDHFNKQANIITTEMDVLLQVELDPSYYDEGKRLTQIKGCIDCHGEDLAGKVFIDEPVIGTYAGPNLTSHEKGVGSDYSTGDWVRAIRYGRNKEGRLLKFMPSEEYTQITDEDLAKMISYLKEMPPIDKESTSIEVGPIAKIQYYFKKMPLLLSGLNLDPKQKPMVKIEINESVDYGKYLANSCVGCHNPQFTGGKIPGVPPTWPEATNITNHGVISRYNFDEFKKVMTQGQNPKGKQINPTYMPWSSYQAMTETELKAIFLYLKSL